MGVYRRTISRDGKKRASRNWYCVDPITGKERSLGVTDRAIAEIMLGELRRQRELGRAGIETFVAARRAQPLKLLDAYLLERERSAKPRTRKLIRSRLTYLLGAVRSIADLAPGKIVELLAARRYVRGSFATKNPEAPRRELSAHTYNQYLDTLSGFFGWLKRTKQWDLNPAADVERAVRQGQTFDRWALEVEQLERLVERAPLHRAAVYALAANTGLRRNELAQLLEVDLDLDRGKLRLRAATTKYDEDDQALPLNAWTVDVLRRYLAAYPPGKLPPRHGHSEPRGARLFTAVPGVGTLHSDLKKLVGVQPRNAAGEVFDLHALRTTFGTLLARAKVAPQVAKDLMRHADIRTTLRSYTKLTLHDHRAAVDLIQPKREDGRGDHGRASG